MISLTEIRRLIPRPIKRIARGSIDAIEAQYLRATGRMKPPSSLINAVGGDFGAGKEFLNYFVELASLQPH